MSKQKGFFTEDIRLEELSSQGDPLERLDKLIPWENFRKELDKVFKKVCAVMQNLEEYCKNIQSCMGYSKRLFT